MVYLLCVGFVLFFFSFFLRKKKAEKEAKRERKTKWLLIKRVKFALVQYSG